MSNGENIPLVVVGAGYVGLVTAASLACKRQVRLVDKNAELIRKLESGELPIFEPGLNERYKRVRATGNLTLHENLQEALRDESARLVIIAVDTPSDERAGGRANLRSVCSVIGTLLKHKGLVAIMKSTVPPGTGRKIMEYVREAGSDLTYLSCPEFLQEGRAIDSFDKPDRIVVGADADTLHCVGQEIRDLHHEIYGRSDHAYPTYIEMDVTSAEMVKHASNLHLALRVSFANEIANLSEQLGADITDVMRAVGEDSRIGRSFLEAGIGFGGSCFGKDVKALHGVAEDHGVDLQLPTAVLSINKRQVDHAVLKLKQHLGTLHGRRVSILGLAFKPKTDDLRGSPAFGLAAALRDEGVTLSAWDPEPRARERAAANGADGHAEWLRPLEIAASPWHALEAADAAVLVTDWDEFAELDWRKVAKTMHGNLILDGRNHLPTAMIRAAGLVYVGTGRESSGIPTR